MAAHVVLGVALALRHAESTDGGGQQPQCSPPGQELREVDFLVVGAGPAGVQWATLLHRAGMATRYVVLEQASGAGAFFRVYPRKRKLISQNKCIIGDPGPGDYAERFDGHSILGADPSFCAYDSAFFPEADRLADYLQHVSQDLQIRYNTRVVEAETDLRGRHLVRTCSNETWATRHLIIATGYHPRPPERDVLNFVSRQSQRTLFTYQSFPDLDERGRHAFCYNKTVFVLGGGNAAFETADMLVNCASYVALLFKRAPHMAGLTRYPGDVRWASMGIANRYQFKSLDHMDVMTPADMDEDSDKFEEDGVTVYCGGWLSHDASAPSLVPLAANASGDRRERYPAMGPFYGATGVQNKWYAGAVAHGADYPRSNGGFIKGIRYTSRAQYRFIMAKDYGHPWPSQLFPWRPPSGAPEAGQAADGVARFLARAIVDRFQSAAASFVMYGEIYDVCYFSTDDDGWRLLEEVPIHGIAELLKLLGDSHGRVVPVLVAGFELGQLDSNEHDGRHTWEFPFLFDQKRIVHLRKIKNYVPHNLYNHPVIRSVHVHLEDGSLALADEFHIEEEIQGRYSSAEVEAEVLRAVRALLPGTGPTGRTDAGRARPP